MHDNASKTKGLAWIVLACLLGAFFAVGLAPLAHLIPWRWETRLAMMLGSDAPKPGCHPSPQAQALLQKLVTRIYPVGPDDAEFSIDVRVVKEADINAYAALGGHITVYSGLLGQAESPEELAGILAHETEHVHHRHVLEGFMAHMLTAQGISLIFSGSPSVSGDWANYFLNMDFTRTQEAQADRDGLRRLAMAHVDNRGFRRFFERMEKTESAAAFLSDHPASSERRRMAENVANENVTPVMTPEEWNILKRYCAER